MSPLATTGKPTIPGPQNHGPGTGEAHLFIYPGCSRILFLLFASKAAESRLSSKLALASRTAHGRFSDRALALRTGSRRSGPLTHSLDEKRPRPSEIKSNTPCTR